MKESAIFAILLFVLCAVPLMLSIDTRAESTALDAQGMEAPAAAHPADYVRPTREQKLASCMALWEPETHMSKTLWMTVCKRLETGD